MESERFPIARLLDGRGTGVIRSLGTHFSVIEFNDGAYYWHIYVENEDFEIIGYINLERKFIE